MPIEIQYVSDIHLEAHDRKDEGHITPSMFVQPKAPYLALCGDIGNPYLKAYEAFLSWCSKSWKLIFLVSGNHEYYNYRSPIKSDMPTRNQRIREIVKQFPNIIYLDCSSYTMPEHNLVILGCTLWSDTSVGDEMKIITYMNDARSIYLSGTDNLIPSKMTALHFQQKDWLQGEIEKAEKKGQDVLVLTHYLPSYQLVADIYSDSPLNMCFASNCEDIIKAPVKVWICGHSHTGADMMINGVRCLMNPYGYPGERVKTRSTQKTILLETKEKEIA